MLFLHDQGLVLLLLGQFAARLECGLTAALLGAGMNPDQVAHLRALHLPDLQGLAAGTPPVVSLAIDTDALVRSLEALSGRNELLRLRDAFIVQGASPALMRTLFSLRTKVTVQRRRELKVRRGRGRPQLPDRAVRDAVQARWHTIREADPRRRYLALREAFPEHSLETLHIIVTEYEAMSAKRPIRTPRLRTGNTAVIRPSA